MTQIALTYNPTSWNSEADAPWPGGMADCLAQPIIRHLPEGSYTIVRTPQPDAVNVYYAYRDRYGPLGSRSPGYEPGRVSVFAGHGVADKGWRPARKVAAYDHVFTSGPTWTRQYARDGLGAPRVIEAGYPKLDPIINGELEPLPRDDRIRVLWAPTHGGGGERQRNAKAQPNRAASRRSTHHHRDAILGLLPASEFDVLVCLHPRHRPDWRSTLQEYVNADVVIADGGSTIYESWALDLPVVMPDWLVAAANMRPHTHEGQIYAGRIGRHAVVPQDLARLVAEAARDGITGPEQDFIEPILPRKYRGISGRLHAEALLGIAAKPVRHTGRTRRLKVTYQRIDGKVVQVPAGSAAARNLERHKQWERVPA